MSVIVREGRFQRVRPDARTRNATPRKLAAHRRAYDQRRRATPLTPEAKDYAALVRLDVCSYCGTRCGQMAADHIVPLDAGGENDWTNLTGAGRPCNASKKAKSLLHWMLERITREPTR